MDGEVKKALETLERATANCTRGDRHIVVLDRGWVFAGSLSQDDKGVYTLTDCVNVRKWNKGGFGLMVENPKAAETTVDKCVPIRFHKNALIFVVPIPATWEA